MSIKNILFLIPYRMYSGLEKIQNQLKDAGFVSQEFFISLDENENPSDCSVLKEIFNEYDNKITAVVYPSSCSYIFNWDGWQDRVNGKTNINRYLEFFSQKNIPLLGFQMSETGVFDDTLGCYGNDKILQTSILKRFA